MAEKEYGRIVNSDPKENIREKPHTASVGNETKFKESEAFGRSSGSIVGEASLRSAANHLRENHASGVKHMPLHGLRGKAK